MRGRSGDDAPPGPEGAFEELAAGGLRAGAEEAWELFERAWPALSRRLGGLLRGLGAREDLREDCGQAALLRVWKARTRYRGTGRGELVAWLRTIAQRELLRLLEMKDRLPTTATDRAEPGEEPAPLEPASSADPTADEAARADARGALETCLAELKEAQREVVELLYAADALTEREAAVVLERSKSHVNTLRQQALVALEGCLRRKGVTA